ncbi:MULTISPECIES: protein-glutamate O-methyltransferase CheR [unclassified Sulfurospirillum]|uniref:CheR family methyltransferase n=1 Tax=unclassified Sulfurospirillum TaxID=2618290 RepID=UPI000501E662|nr:MULTISPECIES: protein-glutamate O-methyltransferase CheR [unclassified Sulfurospirillum]KFL33447.1 protein-glutamate O-methyltransferase [Sulfurospirillum sp. SCADC]
MVERLVLKHKEFTLFQAYIYQHIGISLGDHKIYLVQARLAKRVKQLGLESFGAYYDYLVADKKGGELEYLSSLISTNVTSFFREAKQWEFLKKELPAILERSGGKLRIWSAACSSGEEPYSIAMFLMEHLPNYTQYDIKILATDVSAKVLKIAMNGLYSQKAIFSLNERYVRKYFSEEMVEGEVCYRIRDVVKQRILFREFNLVTGDYSLFDAKVLNIIFCRNVMIYFNKPTQSALVDRFYTILPKNGYLFIGSSEALTDMKKDFRSKSASIYQKA